MKFKILFLFTVFFNLAINVSFAQENNIEINKIDTEITNTVTVGIDGMVCQEGCADKIAENLKEKNGILSADVSFDNKNGIIVFNPTLISIEEIKSTITDTKVKNYIYTINSVNFQENE
jgi:copper chaperone CopZ